MAGPATFKIAICCIVVLSGLAGCLFGRYRSELGPSPVVSAIALYLASLAALAMLAGHLDLLTAGVLAQWYVALGIGPGVGLLAFQWAMAPVAFALTLWRARHVQELRVRRAIDFRLVSKGSAGD
ncbi:MAG TPA: hypothetical protein VGG99_02115 [Acetobacteraceae bacterium]